MEEETQIKSCGDHCIKIEKFGRFGDLHFLRIFDNIEIYSATERIR
jgi:hypothetical protein